MEVLEEKEEEKFNVVYLQLFISFNLMYFRMRKLMNYIQLIRELSSHQIVDSRLVNVSDLI